MQTVLIAGGSGLIGRRLSDLLTEKGYQVRWLSRKADSSVPYPTFSWDPGKGLFDDRALEGVTAVINLAGAGIAEKSWSDSRKKLIISSRVQSTALLAQKIKETTDKPKVYLSGAAIGIYGDRGDEVLDEFSAPGKSGFLAESCRRWEDAIQNAERETEIRTCYFRIGLVMSGKGGALPKIKLSFYTGQGVYFGNGDQWYSWIHIDDVCGMFITAMENDDWSGVYNATGPEPLQNKAFTRVVGKELFPFFVLMPVPAFFLKFVMGEMADTVLSSTKVVPRRALEAGYEFKFSNLSDCLRDLKERKL